MRNGFYLSDHSPAPGSDAHLCNGCFPSHGERVQHHNRGACLRTVPTGPLGKQHDFDKTRNRFTLSPSSYFLESDSKSPHHWGHPNIPGGSASSLAAWHPELAPRTWCSGTRWDTRGWQLHWGPARYPVSPQRSPSQSGKALSLK